MWSLFKQEGWRRNGKHWHKSQRIFPVANCGSLTFSSLWCRLSSSFIPKRINTKCLVNKPTCPIPKWTQKEANSQDLRAPSGTWKRGDDICDDCHFLLWQSPLVVARTEFPSVLQKWLVYPCFSTHATQIKDRKKTVFSLAYHAF